MKLEYLNDMFTELDSEECIELNGGSTAGVGVAVVGGVVGIVAVGAAVWLWCDLCNYLMEQPLDYDPNNPQRCPNCGNPMVVIKNDDSGGSGC